MLRGTTKTRKTKSRKSITITITRGSKGTQHAKAEKTNAQPAMCKLAPDTSSHVDPNAVVQRNDHIKNSQAVNTTPAIDAIKEQVQNSTSKAVMVEHPQPSFSTSSAKNGLVQTLTGKFINIINIDHSLDKIPGINTVFPGVGEPRLVNKGVFEETLTRPSNIPAAHSEKLKTICNDVARRFGVEGQGKPCGYKGIDGEEFGQCRIGFKIQEIIARSFSQTDVTVPKIISKITIPERTISFKDAFMVFENK